MLKLIKQRNEDETVDAVIKTNEGAFIVTKDINEYLYFGHFENDPEKVNPIEFRITQDDFIIYKMFFNLFKDLNKEDELTEVEVLSSGFKPEEASSLGINLDKDSGDILVTLTKSLSSEWRNCYWVKVPVEISRAFNDLYKDLLAYEKGSNETLLFDYMCLDENNLVRTRSSK
ncbi:MAG: hypothetical protein IKX00_00730 [Bacilli bacterium]|nr:hypothetical protein [Bacilli bacterium]